MNYSILSCGTLRSGRVGMFDKASSKSLKRGDVKWNVNGQILVY